MKYDAKVPTSLQLTQEWFGSVISRPIDLESRMNPISPSGRHIEEEACDFILPSPTLRPAERIQIYNQQYWWRLLNCLHENFPLVTRLFGYSDFNATIGIPYIHKYPPNSWSLNTLGLQMPCWIEEEYHADDKDLVKSAADIDLAFNQAFFAASLPVPNDISEASESTIYLQPHVFLFKFKSELFEFRKEMLKEKPEYWTDHDFPTLNHKEGHYLLRRNPSNQLAVDHLEPAAHGILTQFSKGATIDAICEWLEHQDPEIGESASKNLHIWFQEWILKQCLTLSLTLTNEKATNQC